MSVILPRDIGTPRNIGADVTPPISPRHRRRQPKDTMTSATSTPRPRRHIAVFFALNFYVHSPNTTLHTLTPPLAATSAPDIGAHVDAAC
jgi:hypothetical protein